MYGKCKLQKVCSKVKWRNEKAKVDMFTEYKFRKWRKNKGRV